MTTTGFRQALAQRRRLIGSFLKIPSTQPAEIFGHLGFNFVIVDEEHAPLNRETTDRILLACRATGMAGLVRVRGVEDVLSVLDAGADGVLVPHVSGAETARGVVAAARYRGGTRGFSPTTRAGEFGGRAMAAHLDHEDARIAVIAMIEDAEAIPQIDRILAVKGLDAIFLGRGDLAVSLGDGAGPDALRDAVARILQAARDADMPVIALASGSDDAAELAREGVTAFVLSSDQGFLRSAAQAARAALLPGDP